MDEEIFHHSTYSAPIPVQPLETTWDLLSCNFNIKGKFGNFFIKACVLSVSILK